MNKTTIIENAIDQIDTKYVKNAVESLDVKQSKRIAKQKKYVIVAAIAAAILPIIVLAGILHSVRSKNPEPFGSVSYIPSSKEEEPVTDAATDQDQSNVKAERMTLASETRSVTMGTEGMESPIMSVDIKVNLIFTEIRSAFPYYSEHAYSYVIKELTAISDYFGKDFTEMASLQSYRMDTNYTTEFIYTKDGDLVFDISHIIYEGVSNTVTISMSRMTKPYDCFYQFDRPQYSDVNGIQVLLGENAEETYAAADFEVDGFFCRVEMNGDIDLDVLVKCIAELVQ